MNPSVFEPIIGSERIFNVGDAECSEIESIQKIQMSKWRA